MSGMDSAPTVSAAAAVVGTGFGGGYPDSQDSSPRSRGGESWDEPSHPSSVSSACGAAPQKLRLMCSYGGHIMPRPHDKTLCYLGGDTRIVVVDRHATLTDVCAKISRSLLGGRPFTLKYQLPSEDLDSLISVTTDEDLENMIDEYDRIAGSSSRAGGGGGGGGGKSSRLRLFLFPVKPETSPSSSIGSLLDDSKSETWFVDALNGGPIGMGGVLPRHLSDDSMASSINCLLGLEEDHRHQKAPPSDATPPIEQVGGGDHSLPQDHHHHHHQLLRPESPGKLPAAVGKNNNGQEVQSMPDSPMLDTSSSFGSTSSAPSLSNLPPIRVRPDEPNHDQRAAISGLEEHFAHMGVSTQKPDEGPLKDGAFGAVYQQLPPHPSFITAVASPPSATNSGTAVFSPTEHPHGGNRVVSDDEKSDHGAASKPPQQTHASPGPVQQPRASAPDLHNAERPLPHTDRASPGAGGSSPVFEVLWEGQNSVLISNTRVPAQNPEQGYLIPVQQPQQQPQQQQQQQQQQQFQQQQQPLQHYLHPSPHLVPYPSYYLQPQQHMTPTPHYNQQLPLYYIPVHANPPYPPPPIPQSNYGDAASTTPSGNAAASIPNAMASARPATPPQPSPQLIHLAADRMQQPYMGYHAAQHHASQNLVSPGYGYEFANTVPSQPMYYAHPSSTPLAATQYQAVSSAAATMIPDHQPQMHLADTNQTKAAS